MKVAVATAIFPIVERLECEGCWSHADAEIVGSTDDSNDVQH